MTLTDKNYKIINVFSSFIDHTPMLGAHKILKASSFVSPLGPMLAIADEQGLYLLEFNERRGLEREITKLRRILNATIIAGINAPLKQIESELKAYFSQELTGFSTPCHLLGSAFQQLVWHELMRIPYGHTRSYAEQAVAINKPQAYRAVANANGANQLAIIIPCHRIINSNGKLGGYGGGIARKEWLLQHEKSL